jgi:hypothetical protein
MRRRDVPGSLAVSVLWLLYQLGAALRRAWVEERT